MTSIVVVYPLANLPYQKMESIVYSLGLEILRFSLRCTHGNLLGSLHKSLVAFCSLACTVACVPKKMEKVHAR
jgi:hypothetical protein